MKTQIVTAWPALSPGACRDASARGEGIFNFRRGFVQRLLIGPRDGCLHFRKRLRTRSCLLQLRFRVLAQARPGHARFQAGSKEHTSKPSPREINLFAPGF